MPVCEQRFRWLNQFSRFAHNKPGGLYRFYYLYLCYVNNCKMIHAESLEAKLDARKTSKSLSENGPGWKAKYKDHRGIAEKTKNVELGAIPTSSTRRISTRPSSSTTGTC